MQIEGYLLEDCIFIEKKKGDMVFKLAPLEIKLAFACVEGVGSAWKNYCTTFCCLVKFI